MSRQTIAAFALRADVASERLRRRVSNARTAGALTVNITSDEVESTAALIDDLRAIIEVSLGRIPKTETDSPPPATTGNAA